MPAVRPRRKEVREWRVERTYRFPVGTEVSGARRMGKGGASGLDWMELR